MHIALGNVCHVKIEPWPCECSETYGARGAALFRIPTLLSCARSFFCRLWPRVRAHRIVLGRVNGAVQVKSSQGTNSRPPEWQLRELRVPLESPGDVGENALGTVPPLSCKVLT